MDLGPRLVAPLIALVALVPAVLFIQGRGETVVVLSLVSVLLIAGSLYVIFSPADESAGESTAG